MNDTRIDKLTLRLHGLTAAQGRAAADLIAERLATKLAEGGAGAAETLRARVIAKPGERPDALAERIAEEIARAFQAVR